MYGDFGFFIFISDFKHLPNKAELILEVKNIYNDMRLILNSYVITGS